MEGGIFVHRTGFIGGHKTKEGAIELARWPFKHDGMCCLEMQKAESSINTTMNFHFVAATMQHVKPEEGTCSLFSVIHIFLMICTTSSSCS